MRRRLLVALAVVTVVGIATGVIVPALIPQREHSHLPGCRSHLKQISYACLLYAGDHNEAFPPSLGALVPEYVSDGRIFLCVAAGKAERFPVSSLPEGAKDASSVWGDRYTDYVYVKGLSGAADPECVLAHDKDGNHEGGRFVVFVGGMVRWMEEADFRAAVERTEAWIAEHPRPER